MAPSKPTSEESTISTITTSASTSSPSSSSADTTDNKETTMAPKIAPSLTDSERFSSSDGSERDKRRPAAPPARGVLSGSRRRVGIAAERPRGSSGFREGAKEHRASCSGCGERTREPFRDDRRRSEQLPQRSSRRPRRYVQESSEGGEEKPRPAPAARRYVQESPEAAPSPSGPPPRLRSSLRSSKASDAAGSPSPAGSPAGSASEAVSALLAENRALEAERAAIEKYKKMYEAILRDPGNAFLFEAGGVSGEEKKSDATNDRGEAFDAAADVEELIRGLKLKDLLHESCDRMTSSESVSVLSEIRQGERTRIALENIRERKEEEGRKPAGSGRGPSGGAKKSEDGASGGKIRQRKSNVDSGKGGETAEERAKSRSGSKRDLTASVKSRDGDEERQRVRVKSRSNSKRDLGSSYKSHASETSEQQQQHLQRRKPSSRRQDPNASSTTSHRSSARSSSSRAREEKDNVSVSSTASGGSRVKSILGRFSVSSNASAGDADSDLGSDVEDDVVPDLNSGNAPAEKKEKRGLFGKMNGTMKKLGQKVSKALAPQSGLKKYKVGEKARYNIGKIRDSLESFDPCDPTVEVVIVAVHIDAVLEIPYYTIQLPDGSRKQTNMENLIPLEDYNNGTRPYARIKEKRSSSRRRSRREDEDDDDRSVRSDRSAQSNRSVKSSSSRRSTSSRHRDDRDRGSSSRHRGDDRDRCESSSRHRDDRRSKSHREEDGDYRPKVDAMRGGGMAAPERRPSLRRAEASAKAKPAEEETVDEEPVVIKLTSRSSVGSSFALDAAVAAAVGARRSAAMSVNSSSRSVCADSCKSSSFHGSDSFKSASFHAAPKKSSSFHVSTESRGATKPPSVVELSPKKSPKKSSSFHVSTESRGATKPPSVVELSPKKAAKPPDVVELSPKRTPKHPSVVELSPKKTNTKPLKHAQSADDTTVRRASLCGSEQRRSRSTGPTREKSYPHGTCSKCDGCHNAIDCPIYLKEREKHKDAWRYYGDNSQKKQMGEDGGNKRCKATRVKQPADGSCLFHSLTYCLNSARDGRRLSCSAASVTSSSSTVSSCIPPPLTAKYLRRKIASYVAANPNLPIADDPLKEWVLWDSGQSVKDYAAAMAVSGWGGGVEIAACSQLYKVNIHVYEADPNTDEYVRISCFNLDSPKTKKTLHILYHGRNHYDALTRIVKA